MDLDSVEEIKKEYDEKEFLRETAIYLAKETATVNGLLKNMVVLGVKQKNKEYLEATGRGEIYYTCTVCCDSDKKYYALEKGSDDSYVCVERSETSTFYYPYAGTHSSIETVYVGNSVVQDGYRKSEEIANWRENIRRRSGKDSETEILTKSTSDRKAKPDSSIKAEAIKVAKQEGVKACFKSVKLPGDSQRDKKYSGEFEITSLKAVIVPEYEMTYEYCGTKYKVQGIAAGDMQICGEYPEKEREELNIKKSVKPFIVLAIIMDVLGGFLLSFGIAPFRGIGGMLGVLLCWVSIVFWVLYFKRKSNRLSGLYVFNKERRIEEVKEFLNKNGLKPLSPKETASLFNAMR